MQGKQGCLCRTTSSCVHVSACLLRACRLVAGFSRRGRDLDERSTCVSVLLFGARVNGRCASMSVCQGGTHPGKNSRHRCALAGCVGPVTSRQHDSQTAGGQSGSTIKHPGLQCIAPEPDLRQPQAGCTNRLRVSASFEEEAPPLSHEHALQHRPKIEDASHRCSEVPPPLPLELRTTVPQISCRAGDTNEHKIK